MKRKYEYMHYSPIGGKLSRVRIVPGFTLGRFIAGLPRKYHHHEFRVNGNPFGKEYLLRPNDLVISVPDKIVGCPVQEPHIHLDELLADLKPKSILRKRGRLLGHRIVDVKWSRKGPQIRGI